MAIFTKTQKKTTAQSSTPAAAPAGAHRTIAKHPTSIIRSLRVTEKTAAQTEQGAYVFNIAQSATKAEVAMAVKALFKVTPRMVRIIRTDGKRVFSRTTRTAGRKAEQKKAIVFLKKGETIDLA